MQISVTKKQPKLQNKIRKKCGFKITKTLPIKYEKNANNNYIFFWIEKTPKIRNKLPMNCPAKSSKKIVQRISSKNCPENCQKITKNCPRGKPANRNCQKQLKTNQKTQKSILGSPYCPFLVFYEISWNFQAILKNNGKTSNNKSNKKTAVGDRRAARDARAARARSSSRRPSSTKRVLWLTALSACETTFNPKQQEISWNFQDIYWKF